MEYGDIAFANNISCLYPTYIRGEAYLRLDRASQPPPSFRKSSTRTASCGTAGRGALAHLGLARAYALDAKTPHEADADMARTRARAAYKDFLTLWKDADPDIPILKQTKAEYAKLQ